MRLPIGSMKEFRKALDDARPRWAKFYIWLIGVPAWSYLAYRAVTAPKELLQPGELDKLAVVAFASAVIVQMAVLFRAFWRMDI